MKSNNKPKIIAVVGPTGSGKTKLGVEIAKEFNGVIVSADSRQIYKGLDIGTNKEGVPGKFLGDSVRIVDGIPQLLVDITDPTARFTLYDWLLEAKRAVKLILKQDKLPIVVGGTGLYISALLSNWELGATDLVLRKTLEKKTLEELQEIANSLPGELNDSDYKNPRRLVRFIEKKLTHNEPKLPNLELDYLVLANRVDREDLFKRSDERFERLYGEILKEARSFDLDWLYSLGLDYRIAAKAIKKALPKDELLKEYNIEAHRYIRRQQTWWEHHERVYMVKSSDEALRKAARFLRSDKKLVE